MPFTWVHAGKYRTEDILKTNTSTLQKTMHNTEKTNNAKYRTKLAWFSRLVWHLARKPGGLVLQSLSPHGAEHAQNETTTAHLPVLTLLWRMLHCSLTNSHVEKKYSIQLPHRWEIMQSARPRETCGRHPEQSCHFQPLTWALHRCTSNTDHRPDTALHCTTLNSRTSSNYTDEDYPARLEV